MTTATLFQWNGDYKDNEQVRPYLARYSELRDAGMFYNTDFVGKIEGIAGSEYESKAIYMLSCLWGIESEREEIAHAINDGFQQVTHGDPGGFKHYAEVIVYRPGHYVGGTGLISKYERARLAFDTDGSVYAVIPARKRHGHQVRGAQVYAR